MSCRPYFDEEVIDLTCSLTRADHRFLTNVVINLDTDESIVDLNSSAEKSIIQKAVSKSKKLKRKPAPIKKDDPKNICDDPHTTRKLPGGGQQHKFGDCPICWDELGKNRLASTKCGHVFCHKCLEKSLIIEKKCPTCRKVLKKNSDYHPLYLSSE